MYIISVPCIYVSVFFKVGRKLDDIALDIAEANRLAEGALGSSALLRSTAALSAAKYSTWTPEQVLKLDAGIKYSISLYCFLKYTAMIFLCIVVINIINK